MALVVRVQEDIKSPSHSPHPLEVQCPTCKLFTATSLESVSLTNCVVSYKWIGMVQPSWPKLTHLCLSGCVKTSDHDLEFMGTNKTWTTSLRSVLIWVYCLHMYVPFQRRCVPSFLCMNETSLAVRVALFTAVRINKVKGRIAASATRHSRTGASHSRER